MQTLLVNKFEYVRSTYIPRAGTYGANRFKCKVELMADLSQVQPVAFNCEGGLVLNRSTFMMKPGEALELQNFEPDIEGGYRRINGFSKYVSAVVPQTSSASEKVVNGSYVCK